MKKIPDKDEWVSAYLDDEVSPMGRHRGAQEFCCNKEARRRLGRYQLIGDAIRNDLPEHLEPHFTARMHKAVQAEMAKSHEPLHSSVRRFLYWLLHPGPKVAVASIAAAVLIAGLWGTTELMEQNKPLTAFTATVIEPDLVYSKSEATEFHRALQMYLAAHAEYAAPQAMLPYLQLVDYED